MGWILIIIVYSSIGNQSINEPLFTTKSEEPYESLSDCEKEGIRLSEWLTQDFIIVTWSCIKEGIN